MTRPAAGPIIAAVGARAMIAVPSVISAMVRVSAFFRPERSA